MDEADRAQEQIERTPLRRIEPGAPRVCIGCGGPNDRHAEGYGVCWDCTEAMEGDEDAD